jgi:heme-degrading monooxygenase HmoA
MYAVVNHLHLSKPVDTFRAALEAEGLPLLASVPGFRDFYFVRSADDRAIVIIFWDTAEAAGQGAQTFGPTWFAKHIAPHLASEQQRSVGEVLVQAKP